MAQEEAAAASAATKCNTKSRERSSSRTFINSLALSRVAACLPAPHRVYLLASPG